MRCALSLLLLLVGSVQASAAELRATARLVPLQGTARERWEKDLFEHQEIWIFASPDDFFAKLSLAEWPKGLLSKLRAQVRKGLNKKNILSVLTFFPRAAKERSYAYLFVPPQLKKEIPKAALSAVYDELLLRGYAYPFKRFRTQTSAEWYIRSLGLKPSLEKELIESLLPMRRQIYFFYTPGIWAKLPPELKRDFFDEHLTRKSLNLELILEPGDDLNEIARRYAGLRDPRILSQYLATFIPSGEKVTVPLESLLPSFIRHNVNTFQPDSGPNCFNSALSVNDGGFFDAGEVLNGPMFVRQLEARHFRYLTPQEPLQTGDILVYENKEGRIEHASTFIAEGIVFAKNGYTKLSPYVFEYRAESENTYYPDGEFRTMALRADGDPSHPIPLLENKVFYEDRTCRGTLLGAPKE